MGFPFSTMIQGTIYWTFAEDFVQWVINTPHFFLINLIFWYFISCLIRWIYRNAKINENDKIQLGNFVKLTRSKLIISFFGWITLILLLVPRYPPNIFIDILHLILLPIIFITVYMIQITAILIILFMFVIRLPVQIFVSGIFFVLPITAYITTPGLFFIIPLVSIEWYLLSCLIVFIYRKYKNKKKVTS